MLVKKILISIALIFFFTNSYAEEPKYSNNLNENIIKYYWFIEESKIVANDRFSTEVVTLSYGDWILKCSIVYYPGEFERTKCKLP